ncbi:hypothetical protein [Micromonospora sp. Llam0]|uniref:hypothetical protein n=1 Tax=Micromonospora sp. Llam0 TaxID=2485143 RepID=UPI0011CE8A41|nr:hypothetical protein [Micromonospora sp. Llam0]
MSGASNGGGGSMMGKGSQVMVSQAPGSGRKASSARPMQTLLYAVVAGPIVVGLSAVVGAVAGAIDDALIWPARLFAFLVLVAIAGLAASRVIAWLASAGATR